MTGRAVVVSLEGPACTHSALPVARALAKIERGMLHVIQAVERTATPRELLETFGIDPDTLRGTVLHEAHGDAGGTILETAEREDAAAIVLCTVGAGDSPRRSLGETARAVLAETTRPVVLARPDADVHDWKLEEVLLPHDGTPATTAAIRPAAEIARDANAQLLALHVATPGAPPLGEPGSLPIPRYIDQPQHEWPEWATEFLERLECTSTLDPSRVRLFVGRGEPGSEVLRVAKEQGADLIVLAWHGTLGEHHAAVFKTLLRQAPCPMMVLRVPCEREPTRDT